jgi:hypothetical protein
MGRLPNNEYYPNFKDQDYLVTKDEVALNSKRDNTPFLISSHIATKTKEFSDNTKISAELLEKININWRKEYEDGSSYFIPENRWAHEVVIPPIEIEKDLYLIKLSADVYFRSGQMPNNDPMMENSFNFVSRTLYPYIVDYNQEFDIQDDEYIKKPFAWIIRWLPKDNKSLIFFTDSKIESEMFIKTPEYRVDISSEFENVVVPFFLHKDLSRKMSVFRHDSDILYMKVVDNEKK